MSGSSRCELWRISISDWIPFLQSASSILSDNERDRASRFHFDRDRDLFIASHAAVRVLLSRRIGGTPNSHRFESGSSGKPLLVQPDHEIRFNLSHSFEHALIGISRGAEIGVDVERISSERGLEDLAVSHFSVSEREVLNDLEGAAWVDCFYRIWTLKEAYLKAEGVGLIDELSEIEFDLSRPVQSAVVRSPLARFDASRWSAWSLEVGAGYAGAVVVEGAVSDLHVKRLTPSEMDFHD